MAGRTWSYREFAALVGAERRRRDRAGTAPVVATGRPIVPALATVFGAAAAGRPVLIGDPSGPSPELGALPAGTFLVVVTSGSSGTPRPILRTAASWTRSFAPLAELAGLDSGDRVLLTGPLHATLHLFAAVHTLALGAELTDRPELATAMHAVPQVLAGLFSSLPAAAPLRTAVVAGTALPDHLAATASRRGIAVTEYYGAAELSFVAARRYPEPLRPFPGAEVDLRHGASRGGAPPAGAPPHPTSHPGTLWVRSPYLATGYPPGVSGPFRRDGAGFGTVGDLADPTPGGGLLIRGRGDAAITTGGATVIAEDVEAALGRLPGIAAVAVVGVPHDRLGQVVTAVVEPVSGADLTGLRAAARAVLRAESLPRRWLLADRLPRTPSGKIARHPVATAATRFAAGEAGPAEPPPDRGPRLRPLP